MECSSTVPVAFPPHLKAVYRRLDSKVLAFSVGVARPCDPILSEWNVGRHRLRRGHPEFSCVLHPIFPDFFNDRSFICRFPAILQVSRFPDTSTLAFSTIRRTEMRVNGLFKWAKFHVTRMSTPLTAAMAI